MAGTSTHYFLSFHFNLKWHFGVKSILERIYVSNLISAFYVRDHPFKTSEFFRGEGSKICQVCRRIVVKNCRREGKESKILNICRRHKCMVPYLFCPLCISLVLLLASAYKSYFRVFFKLFVLFRIGHCTIG